MVGRYWLSLLKTGLASGHTSHACHAVFLPFPWKADTTSQPVKAWKKGKPLHFCGPRLSTISWIGNHLRDWPWPNSTLTISRPASWRIVNTLMSTGRISVSHALINKYFICCLAAPRACVKILVSVSSWLHGHKPSVLIYLFERAYSPFVTTTILWGDRVTILSSKNSNSSVLLSLSRRKLLQFGGSLVLSVTLHLSALPLFDLVSAFRLEVQYASKTIYVRS